MISKISLTVSKRVYMKSEILLWLYFGYSTCAVLFFFFFFFFFVVVVLYMFFLFYSFGALRRVCFVIIAFVSSFESFSA